MDILSPDSCCGAATHAGESCARLATTIEHSASMPGHLCESTMRQSCENWIRENAWFPDLEGLTVVRMTDDLQGIIHMDCENWPIEIAGMSLYECYESGLSVHLVLREWVEDLPSPRLSALWEALPQWQRMLSRLGHSATSEDVTIPPERDIRETLAANGFPANAGVVRYVVSRFIWTDAGRRRRTARVSCQLGESRALTNAVAELERPVEAPALGLLVTSFCLRTTETTSGFIRSLDNNFADYENGSCSEDDEPGHFGAVHHTFSGRSYLNFTEKGGAFERAAAAAARHAKFWRGLPFAKMPDEDRRRANGKDFVARNESGDIELRNRARQFACRFPKAEKGAAEMQARNELLEWAYRRALRITASPAQGRLSGLKPCIEASVQGDVTAAIYRARKSLSR